MRLWTFFADVLANLKIAQTANQPRAKNECEKHRGQARVDGANSDVAKYVQRAEVATQNFDEEVVKHLVPDLLARILSGRGMARDQRVRNLFHLYSARAFHEQQIPR